MKRKIPSNKLSKETVEGMCDRAGLKPERREGINGYDVFVCDGFSAEPARTFKRFGVERGEFSFGAYCTIWWVARGEEFFEVGMPMLYQAFHNPEYDKPTKKLARINTALKEAQGFIKRRKSISSEGNILNG